MRIHTLLLITLLSSVGAAANAQASTADAEKSYIITPNSLFMPCHVNPSKNKAFLNFVAEEHFGSIYRTQWSGLNLAPQQLTKAVNIAVLAHQKMQYRLLELKWIHKTTGKDTKTLQSNIPDIYQQMWTDLSKAVGAKTVADMHLLQLNEAVSSEATKILNSYKGARNKEIQRTLEKLIFKHLTDKKMLSLDDPQPALPSFLAEAKSSLPQDLAALLESRYSPKPARIYIPVSIIKIPGLGIGQSKNNLLGK